MSKSSSVSDKDLLRESNFFNHNLKSNLESKKLTKLSPLLEKVGYYSNTLLFDENLLDTNQTATSNIDVNLITNTLFNMDDSYESSLEQKALFHYFNTHLKIFKESFLSSLSN
jgi:hypothetical protein